MKDKRHWYDGKFYDKLIAPNQDKLFDKIYELVESNCTVLDVGCGTGRLSFRLADKCKKIVGLDLSQKNISVASSNLKLNPNNNLTFIHGDISSVNNSDSNKFDYAVITYVLHEMSVKERIKTLNNLKSIADCIIIGDYLTPTPKNLWGGINIFAEYIAGKDHFNNFKSYIENGGIKYLLDLANLKIKKEIKNSPKTSHLIIAGCD
jgi:2-polyprenyl-3-methyl-5-hydroxy-6-metoxy-1,4-benzoquinol methylase